MNKYILFFISLISISLCAYLPLKKHNGFDDNVCGYKFNSVFYVKTCKDEGKYCKYIDDDLSLCEDIPKPITLKTLGDDCNTKFECEEGLYCYGGKCTITDSALGCAATYEPHKTKSGWECKLKASIDYCTYKDDVTITSLTQYSTDYFKVCGEINFKPVQLGTGLGTYYDIMSIKYNYIGTVADGKFVLDAKACKSGFALPFYPDDSLKDPSSDSSNRNEMFLKCVNINEIDYKGYQKCTFKYDTDKIYYSDRLSYSRIFSVNSLLGISGPSIDNLCDKYLMTRLEIFSKYTGVYTEEKQKSCATKDNYNEPETCNDNELRKWMYYYENPENYILYYDEKGSDVANYLIQQKYPLYESSKFLYIKFFISLLLLLLF
jgi:hypothetical protein